MGEESYEKQKQFITDANHELKTPLTLILANVEIAESELGKNDSQTGRYEIKETVAVYEIIDNSLSEGVMEVGDLLLSVTVNGKTSEITRQHHVIDMMLDVRVGDVVTFNISRNGEIKTVSITITEDCLTEY